MYIDPSIHIHFLRFCYTAWSFVLLSLMGWDFLSLGDNNRSPSSSSEQLISTYFLTYTHDCPKRCVTKQLPYTMRMVRAAIWISLIGDSASRAFGLCCNVVSGDIANAPCIQLDPMGYVIGSHIHSKLGIIHRGFSGNETNHELPRKLYKGAPSHRWKIFHNASFSTFFSNLMFRWYLYLYPCYFNDEILRPGMR